MTSKSLRKDALVLCSVALFLAFGTACVTVVHEEEIASDLTPAKFFQRAQEFVDQEQWEAALTYIKVFKERFPNDTARQIEAEYLLAQIDYKKDDLDAARAKYQAILDRYSQSDAASLPPQFKILSQKLIERIDAKKAAKLAPFGTPSPTPSVTPAPTATN